MGIFRKIIFSLTFLSALVPTVAIAETKDFGLGEAAPPALKSGIAGKTDVASAVGAIISAVLGMVGILFFLIIVYAGFTWMIARGNTEKVDKSKDMIEGAVIGLIIVMAAYAITRFVFENLDKGSGGTQDSQLITGEGCPNIDSSLLDDRPKTVACLNQNIGDACNAVFVGVEINGKCTWHRNDSVLPDHCDCNNI